jgi:uncharacterized protein with HEPN domain
MSKRETALLLQDMLDAAEKIKKYTAGYDVNRFLADEKTIDATVRNFEVIGEAAGRIDPSFREKHPDIEWRRIKGLRNRLVHEYFGIDKKVVWTVIEEYLDGLIEVLTRLTADNPS